MTTNTNRKKNLVAAVCVALAFSSIDVLADDARILAELQSLKLRIAQLEQELLESRSEKKTDTELESDLVDAAENEQISDDLILEANDPSPLLVAKDGTKSLEVHGRAFIDIAALPDQYRHGLVKEFYESHSSSEFRRLYLGVEGRLAMNWNYRITLDFAEKDVDLKDASITYLGWGRSKLIMGYQKPAFSLEQTGSSNYTLFMTRGLTDSFSDERALGVSWADAPSWGSMQLGAFVPNAFSDGDSESQSGSETESGGELVPLVDSSEIDRYALTGRATWAPITNDSRVLHLGVTGLYASYKEPATVKLKGRPGAHLAEDLVYARITDADDFVTWGVEGALVWNNLLFQTEYLNTSITAEKNYSFGGYYLAGAWMLTGESHPYRKESGKFRAVQPRHALSDGGWGAWELALRYGNVGLNDKDVYGGSLENITLGLNWYMEDNLRAMLNYVRFKADDYEDSSRYIDSQDGSIFEGRLAWFF